MNKLFTAALGLSVAVLPVLGVGVAAADTGPDTRACENAKVAEAELVVALDVAAKAERKARQDARFDDPATEDVDESKVTAEEQDVIDLAVGERTRAEKKLANARDKVAEKCAEPEPTTTPTPTPEPTTPAPTTTPEFPVDLDCADLSDQEAQKVLDADRSDPHNLDSDEDGFACDEVDNPVTDTVVTPSGGVNTGAGPA